MPINQLEIVAYLSILILCTVAFTRLTKAYKESKRRLGDYDIVDIARNFLLLFGFIIIKITVDYVFALNYINQTPYTIISFISTILILAGIIYSVRMLVKFSRRVSPD